MFWLLALLSLSLIVGSISSTFNNAKKEGKDSFEAFEETFVIVVISLIVVAGAFYWFFNKVLDS